MSVSYVNDVAFLVNSHSRFWTGWFQVTKLFAQNNAYRSRCSYWFGSNIFILRLTTNLCQFYSKDVVNLIQIWHVFKQSKHLKSIFDTPNAMFANDWVVLVQRLFREYPIINNEVFNKVCSRNRRSIPVLSNSTAFRLRFSMPVRKMKTELSM